MFWLFIVAHVSIQNIDSFSKINVLSTSYLTVIVLKPDDLLSGLDSSVVWNLYMFLLLFS